MMWARLIFLALLAPIGALAEPPELLDAPRASVSSVPSMDGQPWYADMRLAIGKCWNIGSLDAAALSTLVVVGVTIAPDSTPILDSFRLVAYQGGTEKSAQAIYESARRAIARCGRDGLPLPSKDFALWQHMELTFDVGALR